MTEQWKRNCRLTVQLKYGEPEALDLSEIRQQITQIDRSLLKLLSERHRLAYDVVRSKEVTQKALRDLEREQQLLQELV